MSNFTELYKQLDGALNSAFIYESNITYSNKFKPALVYNDKNSKQKIITTLSEELRNCDEFFIAVAFITYSGLQLFKEIFKELKVKNIKGKILTTDYLSFTEPKALLTLKNEFPNIEIKMYKTHSLNEGFHVKSYIFKQKDIYKLIIGSSNLTDKALTINKEWNTKLFSTKDGEFIKNVKNEFDKLFDKGISLDKYLDTYTTIYNHQKALFLEKSLQNSTKNFIFEPNTMQIKFCENLLDLISKGENKGLLISATGTGKTYASAFGVKKLILKKFYF